MSTIWTNLAKTLQFDSAYILESNGYYLQEDGFKYILENSGSGPTVWTNLIKN